MNKIIIFSHGFGVRSNYKDLLPDIAKHFSDRKSILFDYNEYDETTNTLTVKPIGEQVKVLRSKINKAKHDNPDSELGLICHSQGCLVAALANPDGIHKTIFLAPPVDEAKTSIIELLQERPGGKYDPDGISIFPRRDGSITHIPAGYWKDRAAIDTMLDKYRSYIDGHDTIIVRATEDEVLGNTQLDSLGVTVRDIPADHNFTGEARQQLLKYLESIL